MNFDSIMSLKPLHFLFKTKNPYEGFKCYFLEITKIFFYMKTLLKSTDIFLAAYTIHKREYAPMLLTCISCFEGNFSYPKEICHFL